MHFHAKFVNLCRTIFLISSVAFPVASASATDINCVSTVNAVAVSTGGQLFATFAGQQPAMLCSVYGSVTTTNGNKVIEPDTCRAWMTMFMTAKSTQQKVNFSIDTTQTCATLAPMSYLSPNPFPYWMELGGN
jgi:hypothetical protein